MLKFIGYMPRQEYDIYKQLTEMRLASFFLILACYCITRIIAKTLRFIGYMPRQEYDIYKQLTEMRLASFFLILTITLQSVIFYLFRTSNLYPFPIQCIFYCDRHFTASGSALCR